MARRHYKSHLLIVDDDSHIRSALKALLEAEGYRVTAVESAKKALEHLDQDIDLILADVKMPEMTGLELLADVKKSNPEIPFIIFTGAGDKKTMTSALKKGANDYIEKPFHSDEILFSVKRVLKIQKMEREIKGSAERLIQSAKMASMGQLNASIAHELNNPLTGIKGYAQLMKKKCPREAKLIIEQADHMIEVIENVRQFSKRSSFKPKKQSILNPLKRALELMSAQLHTHGINIKKKIKKELPFVNIDVTRFQQVFLNLISNAQDAIEEKREKEGEISIEIYETHRKDGLRSMIIKVSDNGIGFIEKTNKDKLFEAFFSTKKSGVGLGLSIVKDIINEHRGDIQCESEFQKGTTFTITLPIQNKIKKAA